MYPYITKATGEFALGHNHPIWVPRLLQWSHFPLHIPFPLLSHYNDSPVHYSFLFDKKIL